MSYRIAFKGDLEPITVSNERGILLIKSLAEGQRGMIQLEGSMFDIGSIKAVIPTKDDFDGRKFSSNKEMEWLEKELKPFKQSERNGRLLSPFDLYLISKGIRGQYENGTLYCIDPVEDSRLGRINADMEKVEYYLWEKEIKSIPGELEAHQTKMRDKYFKGAKDLANKFRI